MLNIESELRSLRSELEDRNKTCRGTPLSSRQDQSKELNETQADSSERGQSSSKRRRSGNNETEMNSPVESNLLRNDVCDSAVSNNMGQTQHTKNNEPFRNQQHEKETTESTIHSSKIENRLEGTSPQTLLHLNNTKLEGDMENTETSTSSMSSLSYDNQYQLQNDESSLGLESRILVDTNSKETIINKPHKTSAFKKVTRDENATCPENATAID
jgi:hypothetical protein